MGMFGYMTDTETVEPLDTLDVESEGQNLPFDWSCFFLSHVTSRRLTELYIRASIFCEGEDMESLLYHFLDDWLYKFCADLFFVPRVCWLSNSSALDFHIPLTSFVFCLLFYVLTTSPLGNQSVEH